MLEELDVSNYCQHCKMHRYHRSLSLSVSGKCLISHCVRYKIFYRIILVFVNHLRIDTGD